MNIKIVTRTITEKTTKNGVKFWAVESNAGDKYTVWDEDIAKTLENAFGQELEVEMKETAGGYKNIRGIVSGNITPKVCSPTVQATPIKVNECYQPVSRDKNITAQCLTKCACGDKGVAMEEVLRIYEFFISKL